MMRKSVNLLLKLACPNRIYETVQAAPRFSIRFFTSTTIRIFRIRDDISSLTPNFTRSYSTLQVKRPSTVADDRPNAKTTVPDDEEVDRLTSSTLTLELINHLERTSLVEFGNEEALSRLSEAINFSNILFEVDTTGVEPMVSVLDKSSLRLRDDIVEVASRDDILMNAELVEEDFFVSPPGNIPLSPKTKDDFLKSENTTN